MHRIVIPSFILTFLLLAGCVNQDEHLIAACKQELDQAYLRVGKPASKDIETMTKIQKESSSEITKLAFSEDGLSIAASALKDHILIVIFRGNKESSRIEWRPPE